jgi:hypothetical protein
VHDAFNGWRFGGAGIIVALLATALARSSVCLASHADAAMSS